MGATGPRARRLRVANRVDPGLVSCPIGDDLPEHVSQGSGWRRE